MKTLVKLAKRIEIDDENSTLEVVKHVWMDEPFPVDTVFVADGVTYAYTGLTFRDISGEEEMFGMVYVEAMPRDVTDVAEDVPMHGVELDMATGEISNVTVN